MRSTAIYLRKHRHSSWS